MNTTDPWLKHLNLQTRLYYLGMQLLADNALANESPSAALNRFDRLWHEYIESGEGLKNAPTTSDAATLERLKKGAASLSKIMNSLREEAAAHMRTLRACLVQTRSVLWPGSRPEAKPRLIRTQV